MIAASVLIVRSAWTGNVTDNSITARSLMDGATSMRNAGIALLVVLFVVAAFVSTAMGTSVGTIAVVSPIAVEVAQMAGFGVPFCVATVIGGAMFGDNLSFISDTTIAATSTQGCKMKDKFHVNFIIALPAAILAVLIITAISFATHANTVAENSYTVPGGTA